MHLLAEIISRYSYYRFEFGSNFKIGLIDLLFFWIIFSFRRPSTKDSKHKFNVFKSQMVSQRKVSLISWPENRSLLK